MKEFALKSDLAINQTTNLEFEAQAFSKQSHQFWTLQIGGWLGYAVFVFLAIIQPQFTAANFNLSGQLLNLLIETLSGFSLSYFQWKLIQKIVHLPIRTTLFWSFFSASVLGLIFNIIKLSSFKVIVHDQRWNQAWDMLEFGGWLAFSLATMFVWTAMFFIMLYNTKLQKEHEMLLRAETKAKDAQLQMLRYQINPHFMFNTMNAISTLIYKNENEKANDMLDKLCELFRHSLEQNSKTHSSIKKELDLLALYLDIEKVRFGSRLQFEQQVAAGTLQAQVPTMFLQPLLENSIKYAVEPRSSQSIVKLEIEQLGQKVVIRLLDQGSVDSDGEKHGLGIGLKNTKERLNTMFSGDVKVEFLTEQKQGSVLTIVIPFVSEVTSDRP